ncbi:MAG: diacylglycerol kinase family protein [Chloroflexota bacterium]|nr:diacylglycerol kinase family protein [Chloroflexota bacterium]
MNPSTQKALVIINPHAARGRAHKRVAHVQAALQSVDLPYDPVISEEPGHAIELARRGALAGRELIVAAGGDGTVHETVNGLMLAANEGAISTLGIIPIGSGNDFAAALGISSDLDEAAQTLVHGQKRLLDVGCVNGRYFSSQTGVGFISVVSMEAGKKSILTGQLLYLAAILRTLGSYKLPTVNIEMDDGIIENKAILMIAVGNTHRMGGGFLITPEAQPDDGILDLVIVDAISTIQILRLLPKAMSGDHLGEPAVLMTRTTRLVVESEAPLILQADGETLWDDVHRMEVTVEPGRLPVLV